MQAEEMDGMVCVHQGLSAVAATKVSTNKMAPRCSF